MRFGEGRGEGTERSILEDFLQPVREAGEGVHLKNLYNDYVYFWRWALWKVFESAPEPTPGIVSFITASSYLRGPGFLGMRRVMREVFDELWIVDLEGDQLGARKTENVFAIRTPVAIAVGVRYAEPRPEVPARVRYTRVTGSREGKLAVLARIDRFEDLEWLECYSGWTEPFLPEGEGNYFAWPRLTDIFPWQHSGAQIKRTWPIGETRSILKDRWSRLMRAPEGERPKLFKETRDRKVGRSYPSLAGDQRLVPLGDLRPDTEPPPVSRYAYRSFDRQWLLADPRLGDFIRPPFWTTYSDHQLYLTSLLTNVLGVGPAGVVTALIPDLDHFRGSYGAKHVIPLWRDAAAAAPNVTAGLLKRLSNTYGRPVSPEDLLAYTYGILASPAYVEQFSAELVEPGPRLPLTKQAELFDATAMLGRRLVFLHTYGERLVLEATVEMFPVLGENLNRVVEGELFTAEELPQPTEAERQPPKAEPEEDGQLLLGH